VIFNHVFVVLHIVAWQCQNIVVEWLAVTVMACCDLVVNSSALYSVGPGF